MTIKHVLFMVTNAAKIGPHERATGYYFPEIAHPVHELEKAGYAVEFASIEGGTPPHDGYDDTDELAKSFKKSKAFRRPR